MKAVKAKLAESNPDRVPVFEKNAAAFAKKVMGTFGDYEFYTGESMNPDGMVALLNYRADGTTPYFTFWKDGVKAVKIVSAVTGACPVGSSRREKARCPLVRS